jgi:nucleoside 2-deoxyribosyltransferase
LEAKFSVFFDALPVQWEYEPEGFVLPSGPYLPDFYLPMSKLWIEVKPATPQPPRHRIYLAGKMNDWRRKLMKRGHWIVGPDQFEGDGHERSGLHAAGDDNGPQGIVQGCLGQISHSDAVFAWLDSRDTYGTYAEVGFAHAHGVPVHMVVSTQIRQEVAHKSTPFSDWQNHGEGTSLHDLWFLEQLSSSFAVAGDPQSEFDRLFGMDEDETLCAELAAARNEKVYLVRGDPATPECVTWFMPTGVMARKQDIDSRTVVFDLRSSADAVVRAAAKARAARFEHGENGGV